MIFIWKIPFCILTIVLALKTSCAGCRGTAGRIGSILSARFW